ncbi:MAG: GldG family protein [Gammaproteobacteria bacterium]|nr:GldG family protein [Gammaproteobacteria bacterium]
MKLDARTRLWLRAQNVIAVLLLLGIAIVAGWLLERYATTHDLTANQRQSLSQASEKLLDQLEAPLQIQVFATENPQVREQIRNLLERYTRNHSLVTLDFIDPERAPQLARSEGITVDGEILLRYQGRREQLRQLGEREVSNAIARLIRGREAFVVFMRGHGERKHDGEANFDLGTFGAELERQGFQLHGLTLAVEPLPANTSLLVVAGPQTNWLPIERQRVKQYLDGGGNLLWLSDPGDTVNLDEIAADLGISFPAGVVVDPSGQQYGLKDAAFAVVGQYPAAGPVRGFNQPTLFFRSRAVHASEDTAWVPTAILKTHPASWLEFAPENGNVTFDGDDGDIRGPVTIGVQLERDLDDSNQRAIVIGDGDFLSNAFIGNAGNLALGMNLFNWLTAREALLNIQVKPAPDTRLDLSPLARSAIGVMFLLVLPLGLLLGGVMTWRRRRMR